MALLECHGLVKDYPGKRAVDGVDFCVERGEIVGLLGPNGAGKTTSFRMSCGMIAPTVGHVFLNGVEVTRWPMYKRAQAGMGYLPQDESIFINPWHSSRAMTSSLTLKKNCLRRGELTRSVSEGGRSEHRSFCH